MKTLLALLAGLAISSPAMAQKAVFSQPQTTKLDNRILQALEDEYGVNQLGSPITFWLHVLHNNDGECRVLPLTGAQAGFGGAARFTSLVNQSKAQAGTPRLDGVAQGWVMVSSGDNILPGINLDISIAQGVPYYDSRLFDLIGYSAMTLGNHDFDAGPETLANLIQGTNATTFISSNLGYAAEPTLQAQVAANKLASSKVVTVAGRQVGIIGATTEALNTISTPRFVTIGAVVPAVQAQINALTNQGVNIIIVSTHLQGLSAEIEMTQQLTGVDIVISGGGSELMANPGTLLVPGDTINAGGPASGGTGYPRFALNAAGVNTPIVTTGGEYKYLGRLIAGFDNAGNLITVDPASNPLRVSGVAPDAVAPDAVIQSQIEAPLATANAALANNIIATANVALDSRRSVAGVGVRVSETNVGNIIADSILWQANQLAPAAGLPLADVAIQNGGGIRLDSVLPAGNISEKYTYDQLPFLNYLTIVPNVTPAKLKELLENSVSRIPAADGRFLQIAGMRIRYETIGRTAQTVTQTSTTPAGDRIFSITPGTRIRDIVLNDGRVLVRNGAVVPGAPSVNMATIDFTAQGGDSFPFNAIPYTRLGTTYQRAFFNYLTQALGGQVSSQDYPAAGQGRIIRSN
ncbi:5'-nucleotidase [Phycisphaerae bacterium]|jgi:5'-nucleotidase|nr:5'-nucleotidase [Phycisphaerae bacterium]